MWPNPERRKGQGHMDARQKPIEITWTGDLIGRLTIDGQLWAEVEWSERRQRWCIQDAEGHCLRHKSSIHGAEVSKAAAVALAEAMIRDGRMPDPETAKQNLADYQETLRRERQRRSQQPAEIEKREQEKRRIELFYEAWRANDVEKKAEPLYELLADAFDFAEPDLWKSNTFAALRPRLVLHVKHAIVDLEHRLAEAVHDGRPKPFARYATKEKRQAAVAALKSRAAAKTQELQQKLDRAREILRSLEGDGAA